MLVDRPVPAVHPFQFLFPRLHSNSQAVRVCALPRQAKGKGIKGKGKGKPGGKPSSRSAEVDSEVGSGASFRRPTDSLFDDSLPVPSSQVQTSS